MLLLGHEWEKRTRSQKLDRMRSNIISPAHKSFYKLLSKRVNYQIGTTLTLPLNAIRETIAQLEDAARNAGSSVGFGLAARAGKAPGEVR